MKPHENLREDLDAANLDELMFEFHCDVDMLKAIQVAMVEGSEKAENYTDALFGVLISFWSLIDKFSNEIYEVKDNG